MDAFSGVAAGSLAAAAGVADSEVFGGASSGQTGGWS